jgi:Fur family zinc uptake transcriptional regulator
MPASSAAPGPRSEPEAFGPHDHRACRGRALAAAAALCAERRLRLTPARAFVLERLLASHRALTAYEILDAMAGAGLGSQPPVAYRALDFLVANGLAHRIERLGAFAACTHAEAAHNAGFLICRACREVAETPLPRPAGALARKAAAAGFTIERAVMEAEGLCARCRASRA